MKRQPKNRLYTVGIDKVYFAVPPKLPPGVRQFFGVVGVSHHCEMRARGSASRNWSTAPSLTPLGK